MTVLAPSLDIANVLSLLAAGRDLSSGSGPWTTRFIRTAHAQFGGRWREVELDVDEVSAIWLPPHAGEPCQGDLGTLVPDGGASVGDTVRRLRTSIADYAETSPCCWGRMTAAMREPLSPIIVTAEPLDEAEYRSVGTHPGRVYHLDGLHRLIGWSLAGRLTSGVHVRALVAGVERNVARA